MTLTRRPRFLLALLAGTLLVSLAVPSADASVRRATRYHVGGAITLDTDLLSTSGASAWAIDEYLASKTPLPPLGKAFLAAERKYGVNARFLLAAAMHESAWGTSYISRVKHNLFGLNAYDRDPLRYASAHKTYAANILATAKFIRRSYLTASGRWWGGAPTLRSMQQFWSSSGTWGVGVSRIATSIHLAHIAGRALKFEAPVVSEWVHGRDRIAARLSWAGGRIPAGVKFVAQWFPIELDADAVAKVGTGLPAAGASVADAAASPARKPTSTVAARRSRTGARSITLAITAPRKAGRYQLRITMLDTGRKPLPAAEQVRIPGVAVRVWGDRSVSVDLEPGPDGTGAIVRITNTGRETIPAAPSRVAATRADEGLASRSVVTVTAMSPGEDVAPVLLLSSPLAADLRPRASVTFEVPAITAKTGRATNWLSVGVSILGDRRALAPYAPAGAWISQAGGTRGTADVVARSTRVPDQGPQAVDPTPAPAAPAAIPSPAPTPIPAQVAAATPPPKAAANPAVKHVTRTYSERSAAIRYRGSWASASGAYAGGRVAWSKTGGSTATFTFTGTSVTWIGPVGPTRGVALVLVDGRAVARASMWSSSYDPSRVLFRRSFSKPGRHTLTVKVLSTPGHPYVAIDRFVVRS